MRKTVLFVGVFLFVATAALARQQEHHVGEASGQSMAGHHEEGVDMHTMHHGPADARAEVEAVISRLFDGMRAGDSTMVASVVSRDAALVTTFTRGDVPMQRRSSMTDFIQAVGTPHDEVWDERVWNLRVDVRDNLASAWMDYAFFVGETFSHCGVNAMQLAKQGDGSWEIIALADTRRMGDACELPDEVRNR